MVDVTGVFLSKDFEISSSEEQGPCLAVRTVLSRYCCLSFLLVTVSYCSDLDSEE